MDYLSIKNNKKGFTLAELLIVVAIIAVLTAIAIPVFTTQLRKSRLATNQANARSAVAMATTKLLEPSNSTYTWTYTVATAQIAEGTTAVTGNASIADWTVDTEIPTGSKVGDAIAKTWTITYSSTADGQITGISATW